MSRRVRRKRHHKPATSGKADAPTKEEMAAAALDALVSPRAASDDDVAGLRKPPELIVEPPERLAARRARDQRDGVRVADPRRRGLYVGLAVFVAVVLLVCVILGLIESRDLMPAVTPSR